MMMPETRRRSRWLASVWGSGATEGNGMVWRPLAMMPEKGGSSRRSRHLKSSLQGKLLPTYLGRQRLYLGRQRLDKVAWARSGTGQVPCNPGAGAVGGRSSSTGLTPTCTLPEALARNRRSAKAETPWNPQLPRASPCQRASSGFFLPASRSLASPSLDEASAPGEPAPSRLQRHPAPPNRRQSSTCPSALGQSRWPSET